MVDITHINTSLIGHIGTDATLQGSGYEGNLFRHTFGYLQQYLNTHPLGHAPNLTGLTQTLGDLVDRENALESAASQASNNLTAYDTYVTDAVNAIQTLPVGERLFLPGGWRQQTGGHAMIYAFTKKSAHELVFDVINSGDGIQYHARLSSTEKELFSPFKTFLIDESALNSSTYAARLHQLIDELTRPNVLEHPDYNSLQFSVKKLYLEILPSVEYLGATEIIRDDIPEHAYTGSQLSGTCSARVIHQLLKLNFESLDAYQHFILNYKIYALNDYLTLAQDEIDGQIVNDVHQNNLRLYGRLLVKHALTAREKAHIEQTLETTRSRIRQLESTPTTAPESTGNTTTSLGFNTDFIGTRPYTHPFLASTPLNDTSDLIDIDNIDVDDMTPEALITGVTAIYEHTQTLVQSNAHHAVMTQMKQLMLALPQDMIQKEKARTIYAHHSEADLNTLLAQIKTLETNYQEAIIGALGELKSLPEIIFVKLYFLYIKNTIAHHLNPNDETTNLFIKLCDHELENLFDEVKKTPYLASQDPRLDKALHHAIQNIKVNGWSTMQDQVLSLYQSVLNDDKTIKAELTAAYNTYFNENLRNGALSERDAALHATLQREGRGALWMLLEERVQDPNFDAIISKKNALIEMERSLSTLLGVVKQENQSFYHDIKNKNVFIRCFDIDTDNSPYLYPSSPINSATVKNSVLLPHTHNVYPLQELSPVHAAFQPDNQHRPSNAIQLVPDQTKNAPKRNKTENLKTRELYHLRGEESFQIQLTLDYFLRNLSHLRDKNIQTYLEANLFQPPLLLAYLDVHRAIPHTFQQLMDRGLRATSKHGLPTEDSIVFIRLQYLMSAYLEAYDKSLFEGELQALENTIDTLLKRPIQDETVRYALNYYHFLTVLTLYKTQQMDKASFYPKALQAYFYLNKHNDKTDALSTKDQFELNTAFQQVQVLLQALTDDEITTLLPERLTNIGFDTTGLSLTKAHAYFVFQNTETDDIVYRVHLPSGRIYIGSQDTTATATPEALKSDERFRSLGIHPKTPCFTPINHAYYHFPDVNGSVYIRRVQYRAEIIIQKQWTINGITAWYELQTGYSLPANHRPGIFDNPGFSEWVRCGTADCDERDILITYQNTPQFFAANPTPPNTETTIAFHTVHDHQTTPYKLINHQDIKRHPVTQKLSHFDSTQFLTLLSEVDTDGQETVEIYFERYGFTLSYNPADTSPRLTLLGSDYALSETPHVFTKDTACLSFENRDGRQKYLVAVQPFLKPDNQASHQRTRLKHDTKSTVKKELLKDSAGIPLNDRLNETYITFPLEDGKPRANSPADALYLAYLYLASDKADTAFETLTYCDTHLGGLKGTAEERRFIHWIVTALGDISKPGYVACQLYALSLFVDVLQSEKTITPTSMRDNTPGNVTYQEKINKNEILFQTIIPQVIYNTFSMYQRMLRHMPQNLTLDDRTCRNLLHFYKAKSKTNAQGALGYTSQCLDLKALKQEEALLNRLTTNGETLTDAQRARLYDIETKQREARAIRKHKTILESQSIDLTLPEDNATSIQSRAIRGTLSEQSIAEAMDALCPYMHSGRFENYFLFYLEIANNKDITAEHKEKINTFCELVLRKNRFIPLKKQTSTFAILTNILYRVLHNPGTLKLDFLTREYGSFDIQSLTRQVKNCAVPNIEGIHLESIFDETLIEPDAVLSELDQTVQAPVPMLPFSDIEAHQNLQNLFDESDIRANRFKAAYDALEADYTAREASRTAGVTENTTDDVLYQLENVAGRAQHQHNAARKQLAETHFHGQTEYLEVLQVRVQDEARALTRTLEAEMSAMIALANEPPEDPAARRLFELEIESLERMPLDERALYGLYVQENLTRYLERTNLSAERANELHQAMHQYLHRAVRLQHLTRLDKSLEKAIINPENTHLTHEVLETLMQTNTEEAQNTPAYLFLQFAENILLRKRQTNALEKLYVDNQETSKGQVEKVPMGGGKSTVVLPEWAKKKANGSNLVILEVPKALLDTNHADMNRNSIKWFGQRAHKFEFSRSSDCSLEALSRLYGFLRNTMTEEDYLITTGESMRSLALKYYEILDETPDEDEDSQADWQARAILIDKIINLFASDGHALIDEVHQGLLAKQKLNYTSGKMAAVSPLLIECTTAFYRKISDIEWEDENHPKYTVLQLIKNPSIVKDEAAWEDIANTITETLVHDTENGPFKALLAKYDITPHALQQYIQCTLDTHDAPHVMSIINQMSTQEKTLLAFYKTQLNVRNGVFKQTAARKYRVNYGPSTLSHKSEIERALAIPYGGNDEPRESSRFANINESMNYTTQAMLITGVTKTLMTELLRAWQFDAEMEYLHSVNAIQYDETEAARIFASIVDNTAVSDLTLSQVDLNNTAQINAIFSACRENPDVMYEALTHHILPQTTYNTETLGCNAYHHVDIYQSVQGVSGTPANHRTFHQSIHYDPKTALGDDGLVIQTAIAKNTKVQAEAYTTLDAFLDTLLTQPAENEVPIHAIMDIAALFQGQSNIAVATKIAERTLSTAPNIQYILYFGEDGLYAKPTDASKSPIFLGTTQTDEINQILNCSPNERFTYYDQVHTLGTDIKQPPKSRALALIDHKTTLTACLQGTMRMRGFVSGEQTVDYIVPPVLSQYTDNLAGLMEKMATDERHNQKKELFVNSLDKINAAIHQDFRQRLMAIDNSAPEEKQRFLRHVRSIFFEANNDDYFEQNGAPIHQDTAINIFNAHKAKCMSTWEHLLTSYDLPVDPQEKSTLEDSLDHIISRAIPHCYPEQFSPSREEDQSAENEMEQELEQEQHTMKETHFEDPNLSTERFNEPNLNALINQTRAVLVEPNIFSSELLLSDNFAKTHTKQKGDLFDAFMKPANIILFFYQNNKLHACLVTTEEAKQLERQMRNRENIWLCDLQGNRLAGKAPKHIKNNGAYQRLMEQVLFFNGDLETLMKKTFLSWTNEASETKLSFFEKHILPYRETKPEHPNQLRKRLKRAEHVSIYAYIAAHLHEAELINFNLGNIVSDLTHQEQNAFRDMINILQHIVINKNESILDDAEAFLLTHTLPKEALSCVRTHLSELSLVHAIFKQDNAVLSDEDIETLCRIQHIDIASLSGDNADKTDTLLEAYSRTPTFASSLLEARESLTSTHLCHLLESSDVYPDATLEKLITQPSFDETVAECLKNTQIELDASIEQCMQFRLELNQDEISADRLQHIISHTRNYTIFYQALERAENINETKHILNEDVQDLTEALSKLRVKASELTLKSLRQPEKYEKAAQKAFALHCTLSVLSELREAKKITQSTFEAEAKAAIEAALPELETHRGFKQVLYDIANCIGFVLCIGQYIASHGERLRFFKAETASEKLIHEVEENLATAAAA